MEIAICYVRMGVLRALRVYYVERTIRYGS